MQPKSHPRTGFSYIEMTIAMLVMGILAAIATPSYLSALAHYRANLAARRVVADLHYARSEAQRNSQSRSVQFNTGTDRYWLHDVVDIDNSGESYVVKLIEDPFLATIVSVNLGATPKVDFDRYGRPDEVGTVVVQSGNVQRTITITADGTASTP